MMHAQRLADQQSLPVESSREPNLATANTAKPIGKTGAVGPGDLLDLAVSDCPELTRTFRVDADGAITLPFLPKPLQVSGLSSAEAAAAIASALRNQGVLREPVVIASIREYESNQVSVVGAVNHPLSFPLVAPVTLVNAIARAGGLSPSAGSTILVTRMENLNGAPKAAVISVPSAALLSSSSPEANLVLTGGEEIRVTEAAKFFVAGNVKHPGILTMQPDANMSVIKAVAMSEGLGPYPSKFAYIYRVKQQGQPREELSLELHRVMERKDPDVELLPDDILYIPQSGGKKLTSQMIGQITGFAQTAGSGILIFH
jgi:polysaccharide export outer membrane protein